MGSKVSCLQRHPKKEIPILLVGLDNSGTTTLLYYLKHGRMMSTSPTIGFNVETIVRHGLLLTMWDVGGQDKIRPLWNHYFDQSKGVIFVIDSEDEDRFEKARQELEALRNQKELQQCVWLVMINKQDRPQSYKASHVGQKLQCSQLFGHNAKFYLQGTSAVTGEGIEEGLKWFCQELKKP